MTNTFKFTGVTQIEGKENMYEGGCTYEQRTYRFTITDGWAFSNLVNDKSQAVLTKAIENITIFRETEEGEVEVFLPEKERLVLHICRGF